MNTTKAPRWWRLGRREVHGNREIEVLCRHLGRCFHHTPKSGVCGARPGVGGKGVWVVGEDLVDDLLPCSAS